MIKYDLPRLTWEVWGMKSLSKIITFPSKPTSHNPGIPLACPADACPSRHTSPPLFPSSSSWPDQTPASERFESISLNCYTWRQIYSSVQLVKKHSLVLLIIHQKCYSMYLLVVHGYSGAKSDERKRCAGLQVHTRCFITAIPQTFCKCQQRGKGINTLVGEKFMLLKTTLKS